MTRSILLATASLITFSPLPLLAADAGGHDADLSEIIVTAGPYARDRSDLLQNSSVIEKEALDRAVRGSIGETVGSLPGVSSTSFGPGASRPVLRGLQGERVRVLTDGVGSIDASNTSADHAVAVDPLIADRIEVVRGAATLLYGSSALGGVVNVVSRRIPQAALEAPARLGARAGYATAANEAFVGAAADVALSGGLVLHVDGSHLDSGDLAIPDFAESAVLRRLEAGDGDGAEAEIRDKLPNSDVRTTSGGLGLSIVGDRGHLGASVGLYDTNYGIAGGAIVVGVNTDDDHDDDDGQGDSAASKSPQHGGEEGPVRIDLHQIRFDLGGRLTFDGGLFEAVNARFGYADYRHEEIEVETGAVGTRFDNKGWEGRLELIQRQRGAHRGALGVSGLRRNFKAAGEEAFVPPNTTSQWGLFALQEWRAEPVRLEASARLERSSVSSATVAFDRSFTTFSASLGGAYALGPDWSLGLIGSRSARAPSAEELLADGPHAATGSYELGNPAFKQETGVGLEASLKGKAGRFDVNLSVYWNRFNNFIVETATGGIQDDLPVFQFIQTDARTWGAELDIAGELTRAGDVALVGDLVADLSRGRDLDARTPLPRMPQARLRLGLEGQTEMVDLRAELELVGKQTRISAYELPTDSYALLNLSARLRPFGTARDVALLVQVNNLTNADARRSTSFLKDTVPLAGRDVRLTLQAGF